MLNKLLSNLKFKLPFASNKPMERWSSERLAEVKSYLEGKPPGTWSREDNYLGAEFVIQRYLPADERRTQGQHEALMHALKAKIDWNIDHPDLPKEPPTEDAEFAAWLKKSLGTKVDRSEVVQLLSCFDNEKDKAGKIKALKMFKFWLEHEDSYLIDIDLLATIKSTYSEWITTERIKLLDMGEIKIFQCDIGDIPVQLLAYFSYPDSVPHISITPHAPTQQKFRVDFRIGLVDILSPDMLIEKAMQEFMCRGYPERLVGFDDPAHEFQLFSENL